jgi:2-amino-4-hydroxy-6-hydroxymethyldihydropteridine diphosphokinase
VNENHHNKRTLVQEKLSSGVSTVIIGLGSNMDPMFHIAEAKKYLAKQYRLIKESRFVKTKPIGFLDQADFINGAVMIQTQEDLPTLKSSLKQIEQQMGRKQKANPYGPRTIDLDILVWNQKIIDQDFYHRDFVRQAVLELSPNLPY